MDNFFTRYRIEDRSYIALIKREIHLKAVAAKFSQTDTGKIDIIVSELSSNLVKHASGGELLYRITLTGRPTFEIICMDKGPGISDIAAALRDGTSSTNTMGSGLGAIQRLSHTFQIFSLGGWGTILYSKIGVGHKSIEPKNQFDVETKALCVPKLHEEVCGDGYRIVHTRTHTKILFGDGLGHGVRAKEAMDAAADLFSECAEVDPVEIIRVVHEKVRRTRGLVGCVAVMDHIGNNWAICGVGNISARLYTGIEYRNYMSYNGTIGLNIAKSMKATIIPVERNQHLLMCSDGIITRWNVSTYPSISKYDPMMLAAAIFKDFERGTDDASILIAKVV